MRGELRELDGTPIVAVHGIDGCREEKKQPGMAAIVTVPAREIRRGDAVFFVAEQLVNLDYESDYHLVLGPVTLVISAAKFSRERQVRGEVVAVLPNHAATSTASP